MAYGAIARVGRFCFRRRWWVLAAAGLPDATVRMGGDAALGRQRAKAMDVDRARAETLSLPLTLIVLIVVFGGLVSAGLPVLAAAASVAAALPLLYLFAQI